MSVTKHKGSTPTPEPETWTNRSPAAGGEFVDSNGYPLQVGQRVRIETDTQRQGEVTKLYRAKAGPAVQIEEFCTLATVDKLASTVEVLRRKRRADDTPIFDPIEDRHNKMIIFWAGKMASRPLGRSTL